MKTLKNFIVILTGIVFCTVNNASGAVVTSTGNGSGDWSDPYSWDSGVPLSTDDVVIIDGDIVTVDGAFTCNKLTIRADAFGIDFTAFTISAYGKLTVNTDVVFSMANGATVFFAISGNSAPCERLFMVGDFINSTIGGSVTLSPVLCSGNDFDGVPGSIDNCTGTFNPGQEDTDGDGAGDVCDTTGFSCSNFPCGKDKVLICQIVPVKKGKSLSQTKCVSTNVVESYLSQGAYCGACLASTNDDSGLQVVHEGNEVFLLFSFDKETKANISVYNMMGEKVSSQNDVLVQNERVKLDIPNSSAGIYIVVTELNDSGIVRKVLVQ